MFTISSGLTLWWLVLLQFWNELHNYNNFCVQTVQKNPNIDRGIKYLDFVSGHLASAETQWPKKSQAIKSIQVSSRSILNSSTCGLIYRHRCLWRFLVIFKISTWAEVVTSLHMSVTATSELTSAGCHLTGLVYDFGWVCQKNMIVRYICKWLASIPPHV